MRYLVDDTDIIEAASPQEAAEIWAKSHYAPYPWSYGMDVYVTVPDSPDPENDYWYIPVILKPKEPECVRESGHAWSEPSILKHLKFERRREHCQFCSRDRVTDIYFDDSGNVKCESIRYDPDSLLRERFAYTWLK